MTARKSPGESAGPVEPGPPPFSDVEGDPERVPHHPGARAVPGAGPNPTPAESIEPVDPDPAAPDPGHMPGAGPNPSSDVGPLQK